MRFDLIVRGGEIVDGTGAGRFTGDLGVIDGKIAQRGDLQGAEADRIIDAAGMIVAPGVIDTHTHYDAQINWDPYCTNSGWHGMTTAVIGNCGFGYAPAKPDMHIRYMQMMVNTEQIPYAAQAAGLSWDWETFPQWLDHLRRLPKGVNVASYLPLNPLLIYVMGVEAAKTRPATTEERRRMRELLHEAMDHGALGFSFSYLGVAGNSHVDFDQSPMPSDVMAPEEAFNLCEVLRDRGQGVIQLLAEMPATGDPAPRRAFVEELARRSGQRVFHNVVVPIRDHPEFHRSALQWLDQCRGAGLDIWSQSFIQRNWSEFKVMDMNAWDCVPVFRTMTQADTVASKLALVSSQDYRDRLRREYDPNKMYEALGPLECHILNDAGSATRFKADEGKVLSDIAEKHAISITDLFLDILIESKLTAQFSREGIMGYDVDARSELLRHPRILAGSSDGGAHGKFHSGGQWSTDLIKWLVHETGEFSLEEIHHIMSGRPAAVMGLQRCGTLEIGKAADVMIYDLDAIGYNWGKYQIAHDLPGDEWRRIAPALGIRAIVVNGQVTFEDGQCTGATPGTVLSSDKTVVNKNYSMPQVA